MLALARRRHAAASVGALITGQGSVQALAGAVHAVHAVLAGWAVRTRRPFEQMVADAIR